MIINCVYLSLKYTRESMYAHETYVTVKPGEGEGEGCNNFHVVTNIAIYT